MKIRLKTDLRCTFSVYGARSSVHQTMSDDKPYIMEMFHVNEFLIYSNGEWQWVNSKHYEPTVGEG